MSSRSPLPRAAVAALAPALSIFVLLAAAPAGAQYLKVYYPDIEQGSATLVVSPTGKALLIDAGSELRGADDDVVAFVRDLLESGEVASLDAVLASHYDEDHIGHLEDVLAHGLLAPLGKVYDRGELLQVPTSFAYSDYAYAASFHDRVTVTPGTVIDLGGGATATVLVVNGQLPDGSAVDISTSEQFENAASIGLLVEYGDFDLWIGGDLTGNLAELGVAEVEQAVAPFVGDLEVYTVNHHGSRTSSTQEFLSELKAEMALNQSSADNGFGHPNTTVVQRFLDTLDSCGQQPLFVQQNPGNPTDVRSDDALADGIADPDDVDSVVGLAGTLALLSDGTSYQVSGGAVAPIARATDCASGTVGDFPPALGAITRAPWVPLPSQAPAVEAEVWDEGAVTVALLWRLDGVDQTALVMSQVPGTDRYTVSVPAQPDGVRVSYRVEAIDGGGRRTVSRPAGYFSGTTPIAALRVDDAQGVLRVAEYGARIEGSVTVEPGVFHPFVSQVYLQDASGAGIQVFDAELLAIVRGDVVRFVGELEQFGGQTELNVAQAFGGYGHTVVAAGSPPAPQLVTGAQVGEAVEGRLVRLDGVTVVSGQIPGPGEGNGFLTVTDDGGVTTVTLKVDEDTDVPGAGTPTQPFDLIGVVTQFDAWPALDGGYQVVPRGRSDLLSDEVNLPAVLLHEIHADPHPSLGDANGDGVVSSTHDELVELVNTTYAAIDLAGWTLSDAIGVRHTFGAGAVVPAREAAVVFGGGSPTGDFGNAGANGLVFTASTGTLGLNNAGDTLTLRDSGGAVVQTVAYGSAGGNDQSLTRSPAWSNSPLVLHTQADPAGVRRHSPGTWAEDGLPFTVAPGTLVLSEVLYDADGADGGLEWVEILNTGSWAIDLAKRRVSLGWGGSSYTTGGLTLDQGVIQPCATFVAGGPTSSAANGAPAFDLVADLAPDLQNGATPADGVALFNLPYGFVTASTVPIDAVVYGTSNDNCLLDETGACSPPEVADAPEGSSVERLDAGGAWQVQAAPTPNQTPVQCGGGGGGGCLDAATLLPGDLVLSEVLYDPSGADDGLEWVELYNASGEEVCLDGLSLGWGGSDYTYGGLDLQGTVAAGATFVAGGPTSSSANASPAFDQTANLGPDLQNSGSTADGVALFLLPVSGVSSGTVPYDAVVYGGSNGSCLMDETGACGAVDVGDAPAASSVERTGLAGAWQVQGAPTPNATPLP
jgi:beta-lactamase superfamily II metal-dependent hydrolase